MARWSSEGICLPAERHPTPLSLRRRCPPVPPLPPPPMSTLAQVQFKQFKLLGLIPVTAPESAKGELEITYLDEELRVSRGNKGNLFVLRMQASAARWTGGGLPACLPAGLLMGRGMACMALCLWLRTDADRHCVARCFLACCCSCAEPQCQALMQLGTII